MPASLPKSFFSLLLIEIKLAFFFNYYGMKVGYIIYIPFTGNLYT